MSTTLKLRRGTTAQHASFTGAEGEVTVDTTKDTLVVHDGSTAGGIPLAKESDWAAPPAIGSGTPAAGSFTTLSASGNVTLGDSSSDTATINATTTFGSAISAPNTFGFKNRIINGAMVIDQRNAGASVTPTSDGTYTLDRWKTRNGGGAGRFSVIQSSTSAANLPTSVLLTVTTTSSPSGVEIYGLEQDIEGYNMADFGWGTANAQAVTLSFQVRSSLTGTYCVSIRNSAADRSYVAEFTINSANTFETKTITIPAITTGTWLSTNGAGLLFLVCLGSGSSREGTAGSWQSSNIVATSNQVDWINTSGATFYITGVQLEKGSTATSFDYRPYGTELALCQRYYQKYASTNGAIFRGLPQSGTSGSVFYWMPFEVFMRTAPTMSVGTPSYSSMSNASWANIGQDGAEINVTVTGANSYAFIPWTSTAEL